LDETGFLMAPLLRRTWALRGQPPLLAVRARTHEKVSAIGALVVSPRRRRITLYLALHPGKNIRGPYVLEFLRHLRRHLRGPLMLLWDSGNPHRHREVRRYLATHRHWHVVWLPPYAPELQPQEQVWNHFKYGRLANFAPDDLPEICRAVWREARRVAHRPALLKSLFHHSTLPFYV